MKTFKYEFISRIKRNRKGEVVEFVYKGRSWTKKSLRKALIEDRVAQVAAVNVLDEFDWWKPHHKALGFMGREEVLPKILPGYCDVIWAKALRNLNIKPVSLVTFSTPSNYRKK